MSKNNIKKHRSWYENQRPTYELLSSTVRNTLESLIKNANIPYLSITSRAKEIDSFSEKISRKSYRNPAQEIMDLAGIRVITYIESDALKVNDLIKKSFDVDNANSLDKSDELGTDKLGYRSFHFICGLGEARCSLPEFKSFENLVCEIQVRTVLQHAWAEIEHDRNYKFASDLPKPLKRRLHLLAGVLELVDGEFNNLSNDIDRYSEDSLEKTKSGDLDIELNSITLQQYWQESTLARSVLEAGLSVGFGYLDDGDYSSLINTCKHLKISKIKEIDQIISPSINSVKQYLAEIYKIAGRNEEWTGDESFFIDLIIIGKNLEKLNGYLESDGWRPEVITAINKSAFLLN